MELFGAQLLFLVIVVAYAFAVGAALAGGAWVAWRLLEQGRASRAGHAQSNGYLVPILMGLALVGAVWFALSASRQPGAIPVPSGAELGVVTVIPFIVMASLVVGAALLVRRAMR